MEVHPGETNALFLLGYNYYFTQQLHHAREQFERVLAIDPHDYEARYFLGFLVDSHEV